MCYFMVLFILNNLLRQVLEKSNPLLGTLALLSSGSGTNFADAWDAPLDSTVPRQVVTHGSH